MGSVEFNEAPSTVLLEKPKRGITGWLIRAKLARDEKGAANLMLILAALFVVLTSMLWMSGFVGGQTSGVSEQERMRLEALP